MASSNALLRSDLGVPSHLADSLDDLAVARHVDTVAPAQAAAVRIDMDGILSAFVAMERRRHRRALNGRSHKRGVGRNFWEVLQCLIIAMFVCNMFSIDVGHAFDEHKCLYVLPGSLTIYLTLRVFLETLYYPEHVFSEWIRTQLYIVLLWFLVFYDPLCNSPGGKQNLCFLPHEILIFIIFGSIFTFTLLMGLFCRVIFPYVLYRLCWRYTLKYWFRIKPIADMSQARYSYRPIGIFGARTEFGYEGQKDDQGQPHGRGMWYDLSFHGECLRGRWAHGKPCGAFTSREYGTAAQFSQAPIAYVTSRADCPPENIEKTSRLPRRGSDIRYGVLQVEVSTAGGFYRFLPSIEHHTQYGCLSDMLHELEDRSVQDVEFCPSDHKDQMKDSCSEEIRLKVVKDLNLLSSRRNSSQTSLLSVPFGDDDVEDPIKDVQLHIQVCQNGRVGYVTVEKLGPARVLLERKREAFVFIHGYTSSIERSAKRMAQMFASGHMASNIIPFIFSYSGGSPLTYQQVKWQMPDYGNDFAQFLHELSRHYRDIHILCHSCGAEFFFVNFDHFSNCFRPAARARTNPNSGGIDDHGSQKLRLATLTLLNPDVPVDFVSAKLPEVMAVAEHFTTYNDSNDAALFWSGWLQKLLPQRFQSSAVRPHDRHRGTLFGRLVQPMWLESSRQSESVEQFVFKCTDIDDDHHTFSICSGHAKPMRHYWEQEGMNGIDVIDCSSLEQNIHRLRHNYYMLNTQMVEDICELIGERSPASRRSRLIRRQGNVFNFLCPPRHVKTF